MQCLSHQFVGDWISSQNLIFSQLPRESVLCLMVYGTSNLATNNNDPIMSSISIHGTFT